MQCVLQDQVSGDLRLEGSITQSGQSQVSVHLEETVCEWDTLTSTGRSLTMHLKQPMGGAEGEEQERRGHKGRRGGQKDRRVRRGQKERRRGQKERGSQRWRSGSEGSSSGGQEKIQRSVLHQTEDDVTMINTPSIISCLLTGT